jgi:hypothetical protein
MIDNGLLFTKGIFFADSHGNSGGIRDAVEQSGSADIIIHLGDGVEDGFALAGEKALPYIGVCGNEDHTDLYDDTRLIETERGQILLIHGHQVDINPYQEAAVLERRYEQLAGIAGRFNAGVLLFGHTHVPFLRVVNNVILCNPGSMYIGSSLPLTFGKFEISDYSINLTVFAKQADGNWGKSISLAL